MDKPPLYNLFSPWNIFFRKYKYISPSSDVVFHDGSEWRPCRWQNGVTIAQHRKVDGEPREKGGNKRKRGGAWGSSAIPPPGSVPVQKSPANPPPSSAFVRGYTPGPTIGYTRRVYSGDGTAPRADFGRPATVE